MCCGQYDLKGVAWEIVWQTRAWLVGRPGLTGSSNVNLVSCFHFIFPPKNKAAVSLGSKTFFRNLLATYYLWPIEKFLLSFKINSFWVAVTSGYYWIFGYWFEIFFVIIFAPTKAGQFDWIPLQYKGFLSPGKQTIYSHNRVYNEFYKWYWLLCQQKNEAKTDHRWHYLNDSTYVCPFFHICCNPVMALSYYLKYCHL